jgi:NADH:ubiquinone oxidoreductase subunit E
VTDRISAIIEKSKGSRGGLLAILQDIQASEGFLPGDALEKVARKTGIPLVDVYGVATFYRAFSLNPRGKHQITVCLGTACHVRGAQGIVDEFERRLGINRGETTSDGEFTLETVNCLGACALGPIAVVDGKYYSQVTVAKVRSIVDEARKNGKVLPRIGKTHGSRKRPQSAMLDR